MAQIDHSIYFQQQSPDFAGAFQKALSMREMLDQRNRNQKLAKEEEAVKSAYAAGIIANPDGTSSFDKNITLSQLAKASPEAYVAAQDKFQAQDSAQQKARLEKQMQEIDLTARLTGSVTDQGSYDRALQEASRYGLDVSKFPKQFDPNLVKHYQGMALSAKEQIENQYKQMGFAQDKLAKDREFGLKKQQLELDREKVGIQKMEARSKVKSGEAMPLDVKKTVETLSTKNANKIAIKNQIDAVMNGWDKLSEDQKVAAGRQLLKTLNSTEGADAIGVEEAQRLGSKLEFAMGNLFNSNPTQFGRDLKGFQQQAKNTSANIGNAVRSNQDEIDKMMGRSVRSRPSIEGKPQTVIQNGFTYTLNPETGKYE